MQRIPVSAQGSQPSAVSISSTEKINDEAMSSVLDNVYLVDLTDSQMGSEGIIEPLKDVKQVKMQEPQKLLEMQEKQLDMQQKMMDMQQKMMDMQQKMMDMLQKMMDMQQMQFDMLRELIQQKQLE